MFKFSIPMTVALSSGSITLLALGSLLLMSNTVYTSDIQSSTTIEDQVTSDDTLRVNESLVLTPSGETTGTTKSTPSPKRDSRHRNGRLYGQPSSMDSYAAAYAAANSPSSQGSPSDQQTLMQSTVQANDAISYSSFGESAPSSSVSGAAQNGNSPARQLTSGDYGPHSSYYASYMSPSQSEASYAGQASSHSGHYQSPSHHHSQGYYKSPGYPSASSMYDRHSLSSYYDRAHAASMPSQFWGSSSGFGSGGLMSSASTALSHWTNGFTISEIICTIVAIAIGAIILGAPFFLIYLALMGNFSGSGTLSLTNPTQGSATGGATPPANGRRKRLAIFEQMNSNEDQQHVSEFVALADAVASQLSPFVDLQQVSTTLKRLIGSIEKYSHPKKAAKKVA